MTADIDSGSTVDIGRTFDAMWSALSPIGRSLSTGGYRRYAWSPADLEAREWFVAAALERGLDVQRDCNGNLWAWWLPAGEHGEHREPRGALVTGSHLDSVPDGGAFDGPLGVVSALCAIDVLKAKGISPAKPVAVTVFSDEEGARFGVACVGSRLSTGALEPARALALTDADGVALRDAMTGAGVDPTQLGRDDESLRRVGAFVELHVEQGRNLAGLDAAIGIASGIWPHGRWHFSFAGKPDHAGTTRLSDRHDPVLSFAATALAARQHAERAGALATFGRVVVRPNATNGVAARVDAWLDARAASQHSLDVVVDGVGRTARHRCDTDGVELAVDAESLTPLVDFDHDLRALLRKWLGDLPELATGAGHDAGVLAARVPAGMLFVRNPTGVSHAPDEFAERADCLAGIEALAGVIEGWLSL